MIHKRTEPNSGADREAMRVAVVGNYIPRRCGIATFTSGLCEAMAKVSPRSRISVIAMNDQGSSYDYPPRVSLEIEAERVADYRLAANFIQTGECDLLLVQHEYGIFGGRAGSHLLALLRQVRVPIVVTLHTVLGNPDEPQRRVIREMGELVDQFVVMNPRCRDVLAKVYGIDPERVHLVHHGVPDLPLVRPDAYKSVIGVEGRPVILTFGLLSPGKGIEHMIEAMPKVAEEHPDALYVVLGKTHPNVLRESGESYRRKLVRLAEDLGVEDNVEFQNEFVSLPRLFEFLRGADLYVTPYPGTEQAVSGTLAYAMGTGKAIVSTAYSYAEVMLADGRGRLVPPRDPEALAAEVGDMLSDETERRATARRAYEYSRRMIWPVVAGEYLDLFARALEERARRPEPVIWAHSAEGRPLGLQPSTFDDTYPVLDHLPAVNLAHLRTLTDATGILQHARYTVPNRQHGYSTDDQARALLVTVLAKYVSPDEPDLASLATRYLSFLDYAFNAETDRFRNFMTYDRRWLEEQGSEDSHGRSLWAIGTTVALDQNEGHRMLAGNLFRRAIKPLPGFTSPRAHAFGVLGLRAYLEWFEDDDTARGILEESAERLFELHTREATEEWNWPEPVLSYANAKLPHALIAAGRGLERDDMLEAGLASLAWLSEHHRDENDCFSPVGNQGWFRRDRKKARYDQQPIEAHAALEACLLAYDVTREARWRTEAERAFEWFLGRNDMLWPLYDAATGGCRDGLMLTGMNENQGAESTLAWLLSLLRMHLHKATATVEDIEARRSDETPTDATQEETA